MSAARRPLHVVNFVSIPLRRPQTVHPNPLGFQRRIRQAFQAPPTGLPQQKQTARSQPPSRRRIQRVPCDRQARLVRNVQTRRLPHGLANRFISEDESTREELVNSVKSAMRMVPHPVAIVTSTDLSNAKASFKGATVSSFNTVTMRPDPIVSLNLKKPSSTFNAIQSSNQFIVHLLMDNMEAGELAQAFTKGDSQSPFAQHPPDVQTNRVGMADVKEGADKRPPVFSETKAVSFALLCRYLSNKTVEIGDHIVMFGTVLRVLGEPESVPCLAYANRWYGRIVNFRWLAQGSDSSPKIDLVGPDTIDPLRRQLERRTANLFVANLRLMNRVQAVLGQQQEDIMDSLKEHRALRDTLKRREGGKAVGPHTVQQLMRTGNIEISSSVSKGIRLWHALKA